MNFCTNVSLSPYTPRWIVSLLKFRTFYLKPKLKEWSCKWFVHFYWQPRVFNRQNWWIDKWRVVKDFLWAYLLTAMCLWLRVFWDVALCYWVDISRRFERLWRLRLQVLSSPIILFRLLYAWWWRRHCLSKCRHLMVLRYSFTSQKSLFLKRCWFVMKQNINLRFRNTNRHSAVDLYLCEYYVVLYECQDYQYSELKLRTL
jgi:hypothetical protein